MLLNSHISACARCIAGKVCGLVRSTWGTSQGEDKLGARDKILNTKVAHPACAGQTFPHNLAPFCFSILTQSGCDWSKLFSASYPDVHIMTATKNLRNLAPGLAK